MKTLLLMIMIASIPTYASADWRVLNPKGDGNRIELDTVRSKLLKRNYLAYARTYLPDQRIEIKTEINCSKKKYKLLSQRVTNRKGKVIHESSKAGPWEKITEDSVYEVLRKHLCTK
ncbi:MAG: surface-adhesin E family protein [Deltaproteobacteria bacterium]